MTVPFSYPAVPPLEVPDKNLLAILEPRVCEPPGTPEALVEEALDRPIGSPRLEDAASPGTRVLILVDDITRQTPASRLVPAIVRRLAGRGVARDRLKILIAAGTHALMTRKEVEKKLGPELPRQHQVLLHHWKAEEDLVKIGATDDGTPIRVNRLLREADLVIGVGQIVPHRVMGFTGGATIVQPGVCGGEITGHTHWRSALYSGPEILGVAENSVRLEVEEIARLAGLRFIVNVVMDARHRVLRVVAGDQVAAHRQGAEFSRTVYGAPQPRLADIVVTESYPADYDLWQAAKGIYAGELAVRPGGIVVLVTPCPHGVSNEHPEVERIGYRGWEEIKARLERKEITDRVAASHLAHVGRVICDRARGIMFSPGIPPETQRRLGFQHAPTPVEAMEMALAAAGRDAQVVVLRQGGNVFPLLPDSQEPTAPPA